MRTKAGSFYVGTVADRAWLIENIKRGQDYLLHNTTLGIPALVQTEGMNCFTSNARCGKDAYYVSGIHGFLDPNATIFNSPIAYGCSFNPEVWSETILLVSKEISNEM